MKKSKILMLLSGFIMMFAALAFTSCVDDNDDVGMPYLEVTPQVLKFDADGKAIGASEFEIKTNRPWTLVIPDDAQWVRASATSGNGDGKVSFNLFASSVGQSAQLTFALKNSAGFAYMTQVVTIEQGDVVESVDIFNETFGTKSVANPWPTVDTYDDWNTTGEGAADVTFAGVNTSIRNSGKSSAGAYDGASGPNVLFFGAAPATFTVQNIALTSSQTNLRLQFGGQFYDGSSNSFPADKLLVSLSADGTNFVPLQYTVNNGDQEDPYWVLATKDFTLKNAVSSLYIRFTAEVGSAYRLDDIRLMTGNGGDMIDLGDVSLTVTTKQPEGVTATDATLSASVSTIEGVTAVGFQYTANAASINWDGVDKTPADAVAASFTKAITGLVTGTTYAVRAYATTAEGDTFGNVVTFTPGETPSSVYFNTTVGTKAVSSNPEVSAYDGWDATGSGSQTVTFTNNGKVSVRSSGLSNGGSYEGASGPNVVFFGTVPCDFMINNITVPADQTKMSLTFGASRSFRNPDNSYDNSFAKDKFIVSLSDNGTSWTPITYDINNGDQDKPYWVFATANFTLTRGVSAIYIKFEAKESSVFRLDDITLAPSTTGGQSVNLGGGSVETPALTPSTASMEFPAEADAAGKTQEYTIANASGLTLYADVADKTNFSAAVENTNTVRVKALNANEGEAPRTTTVTVYLSDSPTGEKKATATINVSQASPAPSTATPIADVIAGGADKDVFVQGQIVGTHKSGFIVKDNTGILYVYTGKAPAYGVGDTVSVSGKTALYGNLIQLGTDSVVTLVSEGSYTQPTPETMDGAAFDAYVNGTPPLAIKYVQYTGTLDISGSYYNVTVDGTTVKGSLSYVPDGLINTALNGQPIIVKGYTIGTPNTNKYYLNTLAIEVTAASSDPVILDVTPASLDWAFNATNTQTAEVSLLNAQASALSLSGDYAPFTASLSGTTITVTPPQTPNTTGADIVKTLTVSVAGGNTMNVTLKQEKSGEATVILKEDFADITEGNNTESTGSNAAWNGNDNFPTVETAYQAGGAVKIGKSKGTGSITSKALDLSAPFTVILKVKGWTNIEGKIIVTVGSESKEVAYTAKMADAFEEVSVSFPAATSSSTVKIATSAKRAFIDEVVIEK